MKKSLLALAVAGAFSSAAFAQSSVTLFGVVDTAISYYTGDKNGHVWALTNSGLNSSRLGVRGTEDLGGGLKANFWFEAGVATDNGSGANTNTNNQLNGGAPTVTTTTTYAAGVIQPNGVACAPVAPATTCSFSSNSTNVSQNGAQGLTFNRRMTVGLSGGWGELRLGRDYTPLFWQITNYDPFGTNGVGGTLAQGLTGIIPTNPTANFVQATVRTSNAIEYLTPNTIGGMYAHLMYAFGENPSTASNSRDGQTISGRLGYAGGPVDVGVAYTKVYLLSAPTQGSFEGVSVGGTLTFGNFTPVLMWVRNKVDVSVGSVPQTDNWLAGITMHFGATDLRLAYNYYNVAHTSNDAQSFSIGPVYNLSRRTALYATYTLLDNKGDGTFFAPNGSTRPSAKPGGNASGLDFGIRHAF